MSDGGAAPSALDTRAHGEITVLYWEACRPIAVCPWCRGDTSSHGLGCALPRGENKEAARELRVGLRKHELDALMFFRTVGRSQEPDHYWLACQRAQCGVLFHLRKPPPIPVVTYFERVRPIAGEQPIAVRPEGLCIGDWLSLWRHVAIHNQGGEF